MTRTLRPEVPPLKPVAAACAAMLGLLAGAEALAQQAGTEPEQLAPVVVTGIRRSLESSLNLKRGSHGLVDGIVAEDIGKFPDTNLAESMQRIAGVSIDRALSGEGSKVTVRGVGPDYNLVLLNGRQMPTGLINEYGGANGSRAFDFSNLSSDSISAIAVYKTSRAATPTGGIGASIDIRTARPLDLKVRVAGLSIKANHDASNSRLPEVLQGSSVTPDVSGIYSDTFADGTFGIAISGSWSKRDSGYNKAYTQFGWHVYQTGSGDWGTIPPAPVGVPDPVTNRPTGLYATTVDMRYSLTGIERERTNGQLTLQWAPSKNLKLTLDHTLANNTISQKNAELGNWFNFSFGGPGAPGGYAPLTFTDGPVATAIVQTALFPDNNKDLASNEGLYGQKYKLRSTGFNAEWKASDALSLSLDAHHSTGGTRPHSPYGTYSNVDLSMEQQGTAIAYYDQKLPLLSLPTTVFNTNAMRVSGTQFVSNLTDQVIDQAQLGGSYKLNEASTLKSGLGFMRTKNRVASYQVSNGDWSGIGAYSDFSDIPVTANNLGSYFSQVPGHDDPRLYSSIYTFDFNAVRERAIQVAMTKGTPTHPTPMTRAEAETYFAASGDYSKGSDWRTTERTASAYVQWDHDFDTTIPQSLSLGLRYEQTRVSSSSQVNSYTGSSWGSQNEITLVSGPVVFGTATGKYSYLLPSIDWDADVTDKLKLRASYGHNIGRAGWDSLLGGVSINGAATAGGGTGTAGNPALKPLLSKNLDFSAEYYYAKNSYVAAGAFYKRVSNFIGSSIVTTTIPGLTTPIGGAYYNAALAACGAGAQPVCLRNYILRNYNGQPGVTATGDLNAAEVAGTITGQPGDPLMSFGVNTPSNERGDNIKGVELNMLHMFGRSGFGVAGNYTWVRTGLKFDNTNLGTQSALPGVSNSANLVLFYENSSWSVRGAYNWRGEFLAAKNDGGGNNPVYTEAYGQVDMSIGYKIGDKLTLQADLINLNDGYIRQHGRAKEQLISVTQTGRRYLFGARYRF